MLNILEKNITAIRMHCDEKTTQLLANHSPEKELQLEKSKNTSFYTATYKNKRLCSGYDPGIEAKRIADIILAQQKRGAHDGIVYLGIGMGYHLLETIPRLTTLPHVIVEPNLERLVSLFAIIDFTQILEQENVTVLIDQNLSICFETIKNTSMRIPYVWEQSVFIMHKQEYFNELSQILYRYCAQGRLNRNTMMKFAKRWIRNCTQNLLDSPEVLALEHLHNVAKGLPALLCAAGPSFDHIVPLLSQWHDKAIVIAVDTIAGKLCSLGYPPDFIVSMDPQYWNSRHLDSYDISNIPIIMDSSTSPRIVRNASKYHCPIFFSSSHFPLAQYLNPEHKKKLGAGGSVSTSAFDLCNYIGCSCVYYIGLDLGYPLHRTHASHTLYDSLWAKDATRLHSIDYPMVESLFSAFPEYVENYTGDKIISDARLELYSFWFTEAVRRIPTKTLSSISRKIDSVLLEDISFAQTMPPILQEKRKIQKTIGDIPRRDVQTVLDKRKERIIDILQALQKLETLVNLQLADIASLQENSFINAKKLTEISERDALITRNKAIPLIHFLLQSAARSVFSLLGQEHALSNSEGMYKAYSEAILFYKHSLQKYT